MEYYRTKEDIKGLGREFKDEFSHRSQLPKFIRQKHKMTELGLFTSSVKGAIWLGKGKKGKDNQFKVTDEVMDFITNSGIFDDAVNQGELVSIFGRLEKGEIIDVAAINLQNLVEPPDQK